MIATCLFFYAIEFQLVKYKDLYMCIAEKRYYIFFPLFTVYDYFSLDTMMTFITFYWRILLIAYISGKSIGDTLKVIYNTIYHS